MYKTGRCLNIEYPIPLTSAYCLTSCINACPLCGSKLDLIREFGPFRTSMDQSRQIWTSLNKITMLRWLINLFSS